MNKKENKAVSYKDFANFWKVHEQTLRKVSVTRSGFAGSFYEEVQRKISEVNIPTVKIPTMGAVASKMVKGLVMVLPASPEQKAEKKKSLYYSHLPHHDHEGIYDKQGWLSTHEGGHITHRKNASTVSPDTVKPKNVKGLK